VHCHPNRTQLRRPHSMASGGLPRFSRQRERGISPRLAHLDDPISAEVQHSPVKSVGLVLYLDELMPLSLGMRFPHTGLHPWR